MARLGRQRLQRAFLSLLLLLFAVHGTSFGEQRGRCLLKAMLTSLASMEYDDHSCRDHNFNDPDVRENSISHFRGCGDFAKPVHVTKQLGLRENMWRMC